MIAQSCVDYFDCQWNKANLADFQISFILLVANVIRIATSRSKKKMMASPESILVWLIIGAVAGWLAGVIMKGYGFGLVGDIIVGILGAVVAGFLFPRLGFNLGSVRQFYPVHVTRAI